MSTIAAQSLSGTYAADPIHSSFGFAVRYMGVSTFRGTLDDVSATVTAGADGAALEGTAQVASISTRTPQQFLDHVLSADFFDAANHPQVAFRSTRVELGDDGRAVVDGELTIRGTTLPVHAEGSWSPEAETLSGRRAHLSLETTVDRTTYGINWNADLPAGGKALANEVTLTIELALVAAQPEEA
ncbi:MAG TPA: YceI family protein [Conexibacter sp.]|jgi:polyisoprenoid-binding protein YceI|nr:YceI family protein [Conexibacter sp.]